MINRIDSTTNVGGQLTHALSLRMQSTAVPEAVQCVVLVDTSASQAGAFRTRALEACEGLIQAGTPDDRFLLAAVDVECLALCEGFLPTGSPSLTKACLDLGHRVPLGSTNFLEALTAAAEFMPSGVRRGHIVYVGDGPNVAALDPAEFAGVVDELRRSRVAFHAIGIGPSVNWVCLAAVANATGGVLLMPDRGESAGLAGQVVLNAIRQPIAWVSSAEVSVRPDSPAVDLLPTRIPPLRPDRDSIILMRGEVSGQRLHLRWELMPDKTPGDLLLSIPESVSVDSNAYIAELYQNASGTEGIFLPTLGQQGLLMAQLTIEQEAAALASLSWQASRLGDSTASRRLAQAALRRDPANESAILLHDAAQNSESDAHPVGETPTEPRASDRGPPVAALNADRPSELNRLAEERQVSSQKTEREISVLIRDARALLASEPGRARDLLKDALEQVRNNTNLDDMLRQRLMRQIEPRIREANERARELVDRNLAAERRAAIGRERMRLTDEIVRREDTFKELVSRYNTLVEAGIRRGFSQGERYPKTLTDDRASDYEQSTNELGEAERVIGDQLLAQAPELWASRGVPMTARELARNAGLVARTLDHIAENYRTRRDMERGFMDSMHQVDVTAIPLPDEPPIIYPSAEKWRTLAKLREAYRDATVASESQSERDIEKALKSTTSSKFSFDGNSLEQLRVAIAETFGIRVMFDRNAMQDFDTADVELVRGDYSGMMLRSALRRILKPLELTYTVVDETLLITTRTQAEVDLVRKVYPVGDLVVPISPGGGVNPFNLGGTTNQNQNNPLPGGGAGGGFGNLPVCWLAREIYGNHDPRWLLVREWIVRDSPPWLRSLYIAHGAEAADWVHGRPAAKAIIRFFMDIVVDRQMRRDSYRSTTHATHFQVAASRARLTATADVRQTEVTSGEATTAIADADPGRPTSVLSVRRGLPTAVLEADDLRTAVDSYLRSSSQDGPQTDPSSGKNHGGREDSGSSPAERLEELRVSVRDLGRSGNLAEAAALLEAAILCGHGEPWMLDPLAVAKEASGSSPAEIDRVLLSAADFATDASDLLALAEILTKRGSDRYALQICRQIVQHDPFNRHAYALALSAAERAEDDAGLIWACGGILAHEWPTERADFVRRAGRLAKATIERIEQDGNPRLAATFRDRIDQSLVRDLVVDVSWIGDADFDLVVEEPPGTICSRSEPRTIGGGVLHQNHAPNSGTGGIPHHETYVAAAAFPGEYRVFVQRVTGQPVAGTVIVESTFAKGTDREERITRRVSVGDSGQLLSVTLPGGRRNLPVEEARLFADVATQRGLGRLILAKQIDALVDPETQSSLSDSRQEAAGYVGISTPTEGTRPFFGSSGRTGYQPVITTLPEGLNHRISQAIVSHNRRYVRVGVEPLFSGVGQVQQFNFSGGGAQGAGGGGMGGGGMPGGGGMGGGMGGGGMGGGGMGGMGGGGMGGQGGGMGGQGGGMGGGGFCWVAREVYGSDSPRWLLFRAWLLSADAPAWLRGLYAAHGEAFATWIHDKPAIKAGLRVLMDAAIDAAAERTATPCPASE